MPRAKKSAASQVVGMSDESWRAREDLHTLTRADEIAREPARLKAARAEAARQRKSLERIAPPRQASSRRKRLEDVEL